MIYAVEMGLGALIYEYIRSFIKTGSGIHKLLEEYTYRQTGRLSHKPDFIFSK
jgi:hypothetical protein